MEWEIWYISKNSNCRFSLNKVLDNLGQDQSGSLFVLFRTAQFREWESLYGEQSEHLRTACVLRQGKYCPLPCLRFQK